MDKDKILKLYSEYSSQFDAKIGSLDIYHESYSDFVSQAKRRTNLLDLACGPGNVSSFVKKMIPEINITCVDIAEEMLELAKKKVGKAEFYNSDILNIRIPNIKYDLIFCAFGLPYIKSNEVEQFAGEVNKFSNKGTSVYISCMEGNEIIEETMSFAEFKTLTVQRHRKEDIINCFSKFNFILKEYKTQPYTEPDGSQTTDMIFFFEKN